jgi:hypothetical protein
MSSTADKQPMYAAVQYFTYGAMHTQAYNLAKLYHKQSALARQ